MEITAVEKQGNVPVTVVKTAGDIDGSNYGVLITKAKELYEGGMRNMLLDLSGTEFMSSAGLVALQSIARLMRGEGMDETQDGWEALHSIDRDQQAADKHPSFKLLNPQSQIDQALETVGFKEYINVYDNEDDALASF